MKGKPHPKVVQRKLGRERADGLYCDNVIGTLLTASQPNITTIGTLGTLAVTGNVSGGNVSTGLVTASQEDRCSVRSSGRYHRIALTPTGANWSSAIGMDINYSEQGTR